MAKARFFLVVLLLSVGAIAFGDAEARRRPGSPRDARPSGGGAIVNPVAAFLAATTAAHATAKESAEQVKGDAPKAGVGSSDRDNLRPFVDALYKEGEWWQRLGLWKEGELVRQFASLEPSGWGPHLTIVVVAANRSTAEFARVLADISQLLPAQQREVAENAAADVNARLRPDAQTVLDYKQGHDEIRQGADSAVLAALVSSVAEVKRRDPAEMASILSSGHNSIVTAAASNAGDGQIRVTVSKEGRTISTVIDRPAVDLFERRLRGRLEEAVMRFGEVPTIFTDVPDGFSTSELFPGRATARTFDTFVPRAGLHLTNWQNVVGARISAERTRFFNFVGPPPQPLRQLTATLPATREDETWERLKRIYGSVAEDFQISASQRKQEFLDVLRGGELDVIVVVAHGERHAIHLPDGEVITDAEIRSLPATKGARAPIVVLLACSTGAALQSTNSFAQVLLQQGRASAVLAPVREVAAGQETVDVLRRFLVAATTGNVPRFMRELHGPWQFYVTAPAPQGTETAALKSEP